MEAMQRVNLLPRRRYLGDRAGVTALVGLAILIVPVVILISVLAGSYFEREAVTTKVFSKENVCDSTGDGITCTYLIFTDAGTFQISDAVFGTVRFDSSDVYGRIEEGHTYMITSYGWRLPFFSTYPNIEKIEEVINEAVQSS